RHVAVGRRCRSAERRHDVPVGGRDPHGQGRRHRRHGQLPGPGLLGNLAAGERDAGAGGDHRRHHRRSRGHLPDAGRHHPRAHRRRAELHHAERWCRTRTPLRPRRLVPAFPAVTPTTSHSDQLVTDWAPTVIAPRPRSRSGDRQIWDVRGAVVGRLAGYTELQTLGTGGFGRVVLARHDASGTVVAIKYLHQRYLTDDAVLEGFRREATLMASVQSPYVV